MKEGGMEDNETMSLGKNKWHMSHSGFVSGISKAPPDNYVHSHLQNEKKNWPLAELHGIKITVTTGLAQLA